jgi:hypothetical protein
MPSSLLQRRAAWLASFLAATLAISGIANTRLLSSLEPRLHLAEPVVLDPAPERTDSRASSASALVAYRWADTPPFNPAPPHVNSSASTAAPSRSKRSNLKFARYPLTLNALNWVPMAKAVREFDSLFDSDLGSDVLRRVALEQQLFPYRLPNVSQPWRAVRDSLLRTNVKGIVMAAGSLQVKFLVPLLHALREEIGVVLPIQVFFAGERDLPERMREEIQSYRFANVELIDMWSTLSPGRFADMDGYCAKPLAVLASSFAQVLFLDLDVTPLQDPTRVFEDAEYKSTGWLFYRDVHVNVGAPGPPPPQINYPASLQAWIGAFAPLTPDLVRKSRLMSENSTHDIESSLFAYDKRRHLVDLLASVKMCEDAFSTEFHLRFHGEREAFWLGPVILGRFPAMLIDEPGLLGQQIGPFYCGSHLHFDRDGVPFHVNGGTLLSKHNPSLGPADLTVFASGNRSVSKFQHLHFDVLRFYGQERWPDSILHSHCFNHMTVAPLPPLLSARAQAHHQAMLHFNMSKPFWFRLDGGKVRDEKDPVSMLPFGELYKRNYLAAKLMRRLQAHISLLDDEDDVTIKVIGD